MKSLRDYLIVNICSRANPETGNYQPVAGGDVSRTVNNCPVRFNILGQRVRVLVNQAMPAGEHEVKWDGKDASGRDVSSGVYFSRLAVGDQARVQKMLLLK